MIAHSNTSVVLPNSAEGDNALRFRVISELPGVEGTLDERVRKRLSEPTGTRSANVWEAEADGQLYLLRSARCPTSPGLGSSLLRYRKLGN